VLDETCTITIEQNEEIEKHMLLSLDVKKGYEGSGACTRNAMPEPRDTLVRSSGVASSFLFGTRDPFIPHQAGAIITELYLCTASDRLNLIASRHVPSSSCTQPEKIDKPCYHDEHRCR
jgi:hypothetical protein